MSKKISTGPGCLEPGDVVMVEGWEGFWMIIKVRENGYDIVECDENGDLIIEDCSEKDLLH